MIEHSKFIDKTHFTYFSKSNVFTVNKIVKIFLKSMTQINDFLSFY
jgi:hypothetical protein